MGPELRIVYPPISDYYNRSQIDAMLSTISGGSGYTTLSGINGIVAYYDNGVWYVDGSTISGTGSGDVSYQMLITTSGDIVAQIPIDYITLQKLTTTSGDIISQIPSLSGYATQAWVTTVSGVITAQIPSTSSDIPFSTGFQADGANNTSTTIYTPVMTGDTAPSPFVASADSIYGAGNEAYKAFDQSTFYSAWLSSGSSLPHWIKIDLGQAVVINKFRLAVPIDYNLPTTWFLQGSNDNSVWVELYNNTMGGYGSGWSSYMTFVNSTAYRYYRLYITGSTGAPYVSVTEFQLIAAQGAPACYIEGTDNVQAALMALDGAECTTSGRLNTLDEKINTTSGTLSSGLITLDTKILTTSGVIVGQIPTDYVTTSQLDSAVDGVIELLSSGTGTFIVSSGNFSGFNGTTLAHNLGTMNHYTGVIPAGVDVFDPDLLAEIGETYLVLGEAEDTLYNTGGPPSEGIPFIWFSTVSGGGSGGGSSASLECATCTASGLVVDNTLIAPSGIFRDGIQVGTGTIRITGSGIEMPDNSIITSATATVTPYSTVILAEASLVNYYKMDDASGSTILDSKGSNHGSKQGSSALLFELDAGLNLGKCIGWPWGVSSTYFQISRSVADDFSLELWFRTTAYVSASDVYYNGPALFGGEVSGYVNDFAVTFPNGHIVAGTGNTDVHISSGGRLDTGDWKHVVFTRLKSGGVLRLYVNGLLVNGYSGANASSLTSSTYLGIGGFNVGTSPQFYAGAICHAAIYNAVLTQNSVYAHYLAGMGW